ncbi:MAG: CapA family protein [Gemmatimonadota bacterium]|nr:MAG: CapA family protein [Gemmatimonadota bacterium]
MVVDLTAGGHELADGAVKAKLAVVGDLMLGAGVAQAMSEHGAGHTFRQVKGLLGEADIRFANLEWPLTATGRRHPVIRHRARCVPMRAIEAVTDAGFTVVSVANNHIFDCIDEGLADTIRLLREHGIAWTGGGASLAAARTPAIQESHGIRFGFQAYTFQLHQIAGVDFPGCAPSDPKLMLEDVRRLKDQVDHVIVSLHTGPDAGEEFFFYPTVRRQRTCRMLIDEGATAVFCHHCHVPQGIEIYGGGLIAHGLGSFITDIHDWYFQSAQPPFIDYIDRTMLLRLDLDSTRLLSFSVHPTRVGEDLAVRPLEGDERVAFLRFLQDISALLYDPAALARQTPSRALSAKLARLLRKARKNGIRSLAGELLRDTLGRLDGLFLEPGRVRALEQQLRSRASDFDERAGLR